MASMNKCAMCDKRRKTREMYDEVIGEMVQVCAPCAKENDDILLEKEDAVELLNRM